MKAVGEQLDGRELYERQKKLRDSSWYSPAPVVIADCLQIPENIGSLLRLADAAGSEKVIFINAANEQNLGRIHRTARNCDALVSWDLTSPEDFFSRYALTLPPLIAVELTSSSRNLFEVSLPTQCVFVVGNERHGVSSELLGQCQQAVHIPMYGVNGSMNVTHALAIVLFEWRRQHSVSIQSIAV
jgi:tRNA G18 (ribose-2'-O)-methylase SpoU